MNRETLGTLTLLLERLDLRGLPVAERCRHISSLSRAIVSAARQPGSSRALTDSGDIDEEVFSRETRVLYILADSLRYSSRLTDWFRISEHRLISELSETWPVLGLRAAWRDADERKRRAMVGDLLAIQSRAFSTQGLNILSPAILALRGGRSSVGSVACTEANLTDRLLPAVEMRPALFARDTPDDAMLTAHHEGVHYALCVLAIHAHAGAIKPDHPLHADAQMEIQKITFGAIVPCEINSCYHAQAEEQLCFRAEDILAGGWLGTPVPEEP